ncbi:hypothetical protein GK047_05885 [Paenibacillus sp. SYP-B3998]|uniref:Flagellar hook-length control protein-like C-terminal domain-containing protein n=2 Tax=Paenibacillus sp. SYP-B3998 TaxID=2678564 RepID=A0A6G3ZU31_9BACL|nr:hypothetical protein [Paenibacillus sp. SYP-B3998]
MQMLQSLTMPLQNVVQTSAENAESASDDQPLPEMLLQAMNSNGDLASKLMQDPKLKQWFDQAEQLLKSLTDGQTNTAFNLSAPSNLQAGDAVNLQAQNTLLTLASLTKQQPDNPILQYLNQNLQQVIEPLLPQLVATLKSVNSMTEQTNANVEASEGLEEGAKEDLSVNSLHGLHKRGNKSVTSQTQDMNTVTVIQTPKSKLELLAIKNVMNVPVIQSMANSESVLEPTQEAAVEEVGTPNSIIALTDLQKAQLASPPVDKPATSTMNAANFSEEMTEHVLKTMKITLADGISEAKLSLFPKNLGHVDVKITMHQGQLIAQFAADTVAAKQMLESQLPQLRQALQTQGLQVEKLEVTQNANMQSSMFQDQRQQQFSNQSQRQNKSRSGDYQADSADFNQEIENVAQTRTATYGNSFDVIA